MPGRAAAGRSRLGGREFGDWTCEPAVGRNYDRVGVEAHGGVAGVILIPFILGSGRFRHGVSDGGRHESGGEADP